jgi:hypothetical protein
LQHEICALASFWEIWENRRMVSDDPPASVAGEQQGSLITLKARPGVIDAAAELRANPLIEAI